jgi:hypothetical protein
LRHWKPTQLKKLGATKLQIASRVLCEFSGKSADMIKNAIIEPEIK